MRLKYVLTAFVLGAAMLPAAAHARIEGVWATGNNDGRVQIYKCGANMCGKVIDGAPIRANPDLRDRKNSDPALRNRKVKGLVVLQSFSGGPGEWRGGPVYDPESGDGARSGILKLRADGKLEVKGCVAFICRTKVWSRVR
ncbi:DUF2147 domain-containing protein [Pseudonocardia sp. TMWB2A]|uniref:DUF2147 domain-containing protein n=1 Tax=Pseudonocardia sp. TMWB2A TaxID=687430 RepID=UPI00307E4672